MTDRYATLGITRKRYNQYLKSKGKKILAKKRFSKTSLRKQLDEDDIIRSNLLSSQTKASQIQLNDLSEASWTQDYNRCCSLLTEVQQLKEDIRLERVRKMTVVDETKCVANIEKLHDHATTKITQCQRTLKRMGTYTNHSDTPGQKKLFSNVIMSLAIKIRDCAKCLRQSQQKDLQNKRQLKQFEIIKFDEQNLMNKDEEQTQWFDEQEFAELQHKIQDERNQEILKMVTSIHSLNNLYKQLQCLVIEQGSLLDRIDENIDMAAHHIQQAEQQLKKAQEHQKSPIANRIICILIASIFFCLLILYVRS